MNFLIIAKNGTFYSFSNDRTCNSFHNYHCIIIIIISNRLPKENSIEEEEEEEDCCS